MRSNAPSASCSSSTTPSVWPAPTRRIAAGGRTAGRDLRLGRRRADRSARVPRDDAARGLRLPRRRGALPVRAQTRDGDPALRARDRVLPGGARSQADPDGLQLGDGGRALRAPVPALGAGRRRARARGAGRRPGDANAADRCARDGGNGSERALHARDPCARRGSARRRGPLPEARALIEAGPAVDGRLEQAIREYARPLTAESVDTVILGCTHYPLARPVFERVFGRRLSLVFSADETAREVAETLERRDVENDPARAGSCRFLTTGPVPEFQALGERFLQLPLGAVEQVPLTDLVRAAA